MKWVDINESIPEECSDPNVLVRVVREGGRIFKDSGCLFDDTWYWGVDEMGEDLKIEGRVTHWIYLWDIPEPQLKEIEK